MADGKRLGKYLSNQALGLKNEAPKIVKLDCELVSLFCEGDEISNNQHGFWGWHQDVVFFFWNREKFWLFVRVEPRQRSVCSWCFVIYADHSTLELTWVQ